MSMKRMAQWAMLLGLVCGGSAYAIPVLTLNPTNGFVQGMPGDTVGWGYSLMNDTSFYLLVDFSNFCQPGEDPQFTTCTQLLGTYQDYIAANGTIVAPNTTATQGFAPGNPGTGVGGYTIDQNAPLAAFDSGNVFVSFQEFNGNPLLGGTQVSGDIFVSAAATVQVIPEPATFLLLGLGLTSLGIKRFARRRS